MTDIEVVYESQSILFLCVQFCKQGGIQNVFCLRHENFQLKFFLVMASYMVCFYLLVKVLKKMIERKYQCVPPKKPVCFNSLDFRFIFVFKCVFNLCTFSYTVA